MPSPIQLQRLPLYLQVAQHVENEIAAGRWSLTEAIPSETTLSAQLGVSVGTVRKALDLLSDRGRLVKKQGAGTFVKTYAGSGFWNRFQRYQFSDGRMAHFRGKIICFEHVPAPGHVADVLGLMPGDRVIHVVRDMYCTNAGPSDGRGEGVDSCWLPEALFQKLTPESYQSELSLYGIYEAACGVVICDASDRLDVVNRLPDYAPPERNLHGPFFRLRRTSRTFSAKTVEYRIEYAACRGLQVTIE